MNAIRTKADFAKMTDEELGVASEEIGERLRVDRKDPTALVEFRNLLDACDDEVRNALY